MTMSTRRIARPVAPDSTAATRVASTSSILGFAAVGALQAMVAGLAGLVVLLACPPLFILVVAVVVPIAALTLLLALVSAMCAVPYLLVRQASAAYRRRRVVRTTPVARVAISRPTVATPAPALAPAVAVSAGSDDVASRQPVHAVAACRPPRAGRPGGEGIRLPPERRRRVPAERPSAADSAAAIAKA
jgi:hypothetical protein